MVLLRWSVRLAAGSHRDTYVMKNREDFVIRDIDGISLLIPLGSRVPAVSGFVLLNETGRFVWELMAKGQCENDIAFGLAENFDVSLVRAREDVKAFMGEFMSSGAARPEPENNRNFDSFASELHQRASLCRRPINGTFELTNRCNLACRMCFVRHPACNESQRAQELPASAWVTLAHEAVDNGMVFLLLTGGEIFLRPDFFEIYEPLTRLGLIISLYTNGTLITSDIANRLAAAPPHSTEITLYGATSATYELITGVSGSYSRCCAGIEELLSHRVPIGIKTTITRQNVHELEAIRQMARNWGVPFEAGWLLSKRRDGTSSDVENCRISAVECATLEASGRASVVQMQESVLREPLGSKYGNFYCLAGKAAFVITPTGDMNACMDLALPSVRPLETSFDTSWEQLQHFVDSAPPTSQVCLSCNARDHCPRCPAWSWLETSTLTEPVSYLCDLANARKEYSRKRL